MQSDAPEQSPSAQEDDTVSQSSNKRRRTSERSTRTTEQAESSNADTMGRRSRSSPVMAPSSRELTPPEGAGSIKYTRTGRVSKATKGQRVHQCEDCGKTYTRAEHLRRHQQNHKPGAFPCDIPGCGRSFYREDLLIRHKARHNDPLNPPSRQGSPASQDSAPSGDRPIQPVSRTTGVSILPTAGEPDEVQTDAPPAQPVHGGGQSGNQRTKEGYLDIHQLPRTGQLPVTISTSGYPDFNVGGFHQHWEPSPLDSPGGYESDLGYSAGLPYYQPHLHRARQASSASHMSYYPQTHTSRSPVSAGSSTVYLPGWGSSNRDASFQHLSTSSGSEGSYASNVGVYNGGMSDQQLLPGAFGSSGIMTPEDRDFVEHEDLQVPTGTPQGSSLDLTLDEHTYTNEERYAGAYWLWIHPFYPVIHRPSFSLHNASPLLKAAILALGAHALGDAADKTNARIVHERCAKVLKKRTLNGWHSFRTCDMQAALLVEVYSVFKSRRPPLQFSKNFEDVYTHLANDAAALTPSVAHDTPLQGPDSGYLDDFTYAIDARCRQRLLLACYILDQHHATLFGRQPTNCFSRTGNSMELPFPQSQTFWDAPSEQFGLDEPTPSRVWEAVDAAESTQQPYDLFQSMLMMACLSDPSIDSSRDLTPILSAMEQSPRIKLAYNTFMLCRNTPVRDLLAVAGESWVMAEKLSTQSDFTGAQIESRQWARGQVHTSMAFAVDMEMTPVNTAMTHALSILQLHQSHSKTGLLFQEWSAYLASVVIWARAYVASNVLPATPRLSISIPNPTVEPRLSTYELDQAVSAILNSSTGDIDMQQAKNILVWTKSKIERVDIPHNCGLTNGALDVLGKLATRGSESGWFG